VFITFGCVFYDQRIDSMKKSRHSLVGKITIIHRGLAIYKTNASPFWQIRLRDSHLNKYVVRSSHETSKVNARKEAHNFAVSYAKSQPLVPKEYTFRSYSLKWVEYGNALVKQGHRNANYVRTTRQHIENEKWGILNHFGSMDIRKIGTHEFLVFRNKLIEKYPHFTSSTLNSIQAAFRNVMAMARDEGVIQAIPQTPRTPQKDNPRNYLRFHPIVDKDKDEYQALLNTANSLVDKGVMVRGNEITKELYDLILFVTHSFVRPTTTELYALRHKDVKVLEKPKCLLLTIVDGKTGFRYAHTLQACVTVYERIKKRYPWAGGNDYLFYPHHKNRDTALRIVSRQFRYVLEQANLLKDKDTGKERVIYCLRHTAICMRIVNSEGGVNIFNLAKNAGTSVDQIERFYVNKLPMTPEMARNLQIVAVPELHKINSENNAKRKAVTKANAKAKADANDDLSAEAKPSPKAKAKAKPKTKPVPKPKIVEGED